MLETCSIGSILRDHLCRLADHGLELSDGAWLCGGAIRRAVCGHPIEEGDFDIYVNEITASKLTAITKQKILSGQWTGGDILAKVVRPGSRKTIDLKIDPKSSITIQIHMGYGETVSAILKTFDFTCCQFACNGSKISYIPPALEHARTLRLMYTGVSGTATLARAFRLQRLGFKPTRFTLEEMQKLSVGVIVGKDSLDKIGKS